MCVAGIRRDIARVRNFGLEMLEILDTYAEDIEEAYDDVREQVEVWREMAETLSVAQAMTESLELTMEYLCASLSHHRYGEDYDEYMMRNLETLYKDFERDWYGEYNNMHDETWQNWRVAENHWV